MKSVLKRALSAVISVALLVSLSVPIAPVFAAGPDIVTINILHTNDTHGAGIEAVSKNAIRYSQIKTIKDSLPNALLFDAGDVTQGSLYATMTDGLASVNAMRMAGYDAAIFGNHEFTEIREKVLSMYTGAIGTLVEGKPVLGNPIPVLSTNITVSPSDKSGLDEQPTTQVFTVDGVKIGVFGVVTPATATVANPADLDGITFEPIVNAAQSAVTKLKNIDNCDIIIALTHCGYEASDNGPTGISSNALATNVPDIDLIIDGHAHQSLMGSSAKVVNTTTIVSTGTALANVGKVELSFDRTSHMLDSVVSTAIPAGETTNTTFAENSTIKTYLDGIVTEVKQATGAKIGFTSMALYGGNYTNAGTTKSIARRGETNVNSLIADARRNACIDYFKNNATYKTLPVVSLTCGGGVRATIPAGDITYADVMTLFLSGGTGGGTYVKTTGAILWETIEWGLSCLTTQDGTTGQIDANGSYHGRFPNFGGVSYTYDISEDGSHFNNAPAGKTPLDWGAAVDYVQGSRVKSVTLADGTVIAKNSATEIILVLSDYEMGGGDGYGMFAREKNASRLTELGTGKSSYEATVDYIKALYAADGDCYYPLQSGRVKNVSTGYTATKFSCKVTATSDGAAAIANSKFNVFVNKGDSTGVKWVKLGEYTTDENGAFTVLLDNGPQELSIVSSKDGNISDYKLVDNYAGLINSTHVVKADSPTTDPGTGSGTGSETKPTTKPVETGDSSNVNNYILVFTLATISLGAGLIVKKGKKS